MRGVEAFLRTGMRHARLHPPGFARTSGATPCKANEGYGPHHSTAQRSAPQRGLHHAAGGAKQGRRAGADAQELVKFLVCGQGCRALCSLLLLKVSVPEDALPQQILQSPLHGQHSHRCPRNPNCRCNPQRPDVSSPGRLAKSMPFSLHMAARSLVVMTWSTSLQRE